MSLPYLIPLNEFAAQQATKPRTLEAVWRAYAPLVYTLSLRLLASQTEAEDVTAAVFVRLNRELPGLQEEAPLLHRLQEVTIELSLAQLLANRSLLVMEHEGASCSGDERLSLPDATTFEASILALPALWRVAYVLHDVQGMKVNEITQATSIDGDLIKQSLHHARLALCTCWLKRKESE